MEPRWKTGRLEAFSDGVLAIAITLLVLDIKIDPADLDHLWKALADEWPSYLAYVTSFFTIGGVWIAHHALFERLRSVDSVLLRLNLLLLLAVSFLPFPTGLMADALRESATAERAAIVVYGATALVIELLMAAASRYAATRPELLREDVAPHRLEHKRGGARAALYGIAVVLGVLIFPRIAAFGYFAVAALSVLSPRGELKLTLR
ncbi:TMEM175 family protein [Solirubrobacter soli]|uniref:TMEM175 family protein n=1 Tax=Solirubrobacter soli TaxID=363832 RepID=UPI00041EE319|nr:TMEM175 family protein [Solirubrobacter soli]